MPTSCHHNNPQPAVYSWNRYWERQKGKAFDVYLQGSSLTSLSPLGELWASCDLWHCQVGCKWSSCLCALLACGSPVRHLTSICVFSLTQHAKIRTGGASKLPKKLYRVSKEKTKMASAYLSFITKAPQTTIANGRNDPSPYWRKWRNQKSVCCPEWKTKKRIITLSKGNLALGIVAP